MNERCLELQKPGSGGGSGCRKAAAVAGPGAGCNARALQRKASKLGLLQGLSVIWRASICQCTPVYCWCRPGLPFTACSPSREVQAAGKAGGGAPERCPYLATGSQAAASTRDMLLAQPMDIEELAKLGGWHTAWVSAHITL